MVHPHLFCLGEFASCFLFLSGCGGRTTTCIVITPPGTSPTGTRDSASVRLFSNIRPALMSFRSLTVFGVISLSCGHRARMNSLSAETVVEGSYLLGPMSVPSKSRNLTSIGSFPPAISRPDRRPPPPTPQDPRNPGSEIHSTKQIARNPRGHAKDRVLMNNSCFRVGVESERAATRWEERKRRGR